MRFLALPVLLASCLPVWAALPFATAKVSYQNIDKSYSTEAMVEAVRQSTVSAQVSDGYRVDYAIGPTPDFWADFRRTCASVNPQAWSFGEIVEPPDSQRNFYGLLNGALDFMLLEGLRKTFAFGSWQAGQFQAFLDRHESYFPTDFSVPPSWITTT